MKTTILSLLSLLLLMQFSATAQNIEHPLKNSLVISFDGGFNYPSTDYKDVLPYPYTKGSLSYHWGLGSIHTLGFKAFGGAAILTGEDKVVLSATPWEAESYYQKYGYYLTGTNPNDPASYTGVSAAQKFQHRTDMVFGGIQLEYSILLGDRYCPFISLGGSEIYFAPKNPNNERALFNSNARNIKGRRIAPKFATAFNADLGLRIFMSDFFSFNISGGINNTNTDYIDDHKIAGTANDHFYHGAIGVSFNLFTKRDIDGDGVADSKDKCPNTPKGVAVDEFGCPLDGDKDGVADYLDKCPGTPDKVMVDQNGCPLDTDTDGIPDYLDECNNTPKNVIVDKKGCPLDADADGVPDYLDKCANTQKDIKVDANGCPLDTDGDGVPDFQDKCQNTPKNVQVDLNGCPVDSDGDGVFDYLDRCPGTKPGTKVDSIGCPIVIKVEVKKEEKKEVAVINKPVVLSGGASFESGKSILLPSTYSELDKLIESMKQEGTSVWRIEGYTDNKGSLKKNKKLSLDRATAIQKYLISKGITKSRMQVRGMGPENPVADNTSEDGRAQNRRVEIIRVK